MGACVPPGAGRRWLRLLAPDHLAGEVHSPDEPWPIEAGRGCDVVQAPTPIGLEMLAYSHHMREHRLGPVFATASFTTFLLRLGAGRALPGLLAVTAGAPAGLRVIRRGSVGAVPPPSGAAGPDGAVWLIGVTELTPYLPGPATVAMLAGLAARAVALAGG